MESEGVEIIFVSSDRSPADMVSYMKESHGDWLAVEHGSELGQGEINSNSVIMNLPISISFIFLKISS